MSTLIMAFTAFSAAIITLYSGFGLGTLLMPVIAIFFPVSVAVGITAVVHLFNNLFKLTLLWRSINWRVTFEFGLPALIAAIPGALLLTTLSELPMFFHYTMGDFEAVVTPVKLVIGLLLLSFATMEWFRLFKKWRLDKPMLPLGGLLSGFFGGLSGHQGAFRSAFLLRTGLDKEAFVATNAAIASLVDSTRIVIYGINIDTLLGEVSAGVVVIITLAAFAGVTTGKLLLHKVTIDFIHKCVAGLLYLIAVLLIFGLI